MNSIISKRIMLAAPSSQSGKTVVTCALLQALKGRGLNPISFKVGPDYIDPMFHKKILGIDSKNLDTYFSGEDGVKTILSDSLDRYAVIEGVMGLYDGTGVEGTAGSSYEVAAITKTPIVLVVDASGVGRTVISTIKGMLLDDEFQLIKGVILNKMTEGFYTKLKPVLESELSKMRGDVKVLGCFPKNPDIGIESRHLGLKLPSEIDDIKKKIDVAAAAFEKYIDMQGLLSIMDGAENVDIDCKHAEDLDEKSELTLAVAYDDAFCFYYKENLELFEKSGVKIKYFSPLSDEKLPDECDGILLGGGYPENYLAELSQNKSMLSSIRTAIDDGIPSLAECGGFMYLHNEITDPNGDSYKMVGSIDGHCFYTGHLVRFGYMYIEGLNTSLSKEENTESQDELVESLVGMKGHEFHYYDSSSNGENFVASKPNMDKKWNCVVSKNNGIWGFPHFYYNSNPEFIYVFIRRMKEVKNGEFK